MRSRLLSDTFKWTQALAFGSEIRAGYRQTAFVVDTEKCMYNVNRRIFPLFSRTYSSEILAEKAEAVSPLPKSGKGKPQKSLFWRLYYKRGTESLLEKWINDGNELNIQDARIIVRGLRGKRQFEKALQVSEWMQNCKKFKFTAGDFAIQLDLVAKVHGMARAEKYFANLPEFAKHEYTYCSLLHCYVKEKSSKKAEQCMEKIQELGFARTVLPYNAMMDLYMANGQVENVLLMIKQLKKMDIQPDDIACNLWINACAAMSNIDDVEKIVGEIKSSKGDNLNWPIYSTLANIYIKAGLVDKAESALKEMEKKISKRDRVGFEYLITMYASLGNKEEVHRIWQSIKMTFNKLNDRYFKSVLCSMVKVVDINTAEEIFKEWESSCSKYDCRMSNTLLAAYVREGMLEKAEIFHNHVIEKGGKPSCRTWEILTEGYLKSKQMDKAVINMKRALSEVKSFGWKPRSENVMCILKYFEQEGNVEYANEYLKLLRDSKCATTKIYNSLLLTYVKAGKDATEISKQMTDDNVSVDEETDRLLKLISNKPLS